MEVDLEVVMEVDLEVVMEVDLEVVMEVDLEVVMEVDLEVVMEVDLEVVMEVDLEVVMEVDLEVVMEVDAGSGSLLAPNIAISDILTQLFSELPFTVILTNCPSLLEGKLYFSKLVALLMLFPSNTSLKMDPSSETDIVKAFCLTSPLYHAISTLQILAFEPKSN